MQINTLRAPHPHRWKCTQTECVAPETIGEHLKNRRLALHLFQKDVAKTLGVDTATLQGWERGLWKPIPKYYPSIIRFLGYVPFGHDGSPGGRFRFLRLCAGLSQEALAERLDCALTTLWRWETNQPSDGKMLKTALGLLNLECARKANPKGKPKG